jgi:hypothetical protein
VVRGQLMGSLLTFPVLCLYNYVCFRHLTRDPTIPVKVNGDDIVFRARREVADVWLSGVTSLGLRLSIGKTLLSSSVFSLNSTFFRAREHGVSMLPVVRWAVLLRPTESPHGVAGGASSMCRGFRGEARVRLQCLYLRRRSRALRATGRSVLRDLRCPVEPEALKRCGLLRREAFFLSLPACPLPTDFVRLKTPTLPEGWRRVPVSRSAPERARQREAEGVFFSLLVSRSWVERPVSVSKLAQLTWNATRATGHLRDWLRFRRTSQMKLGKLGRCRAYRLFASRQRVDVSKVWAFRAPRRLRMVWSGGSFEPGVGFFS